MADDVEAREAEPLHQAGLVRRHRAERVIRGIGRAAGLRRIPVAPQVGAYHGELAGEDRRDPRPHREILRVPVQHQHGRSGAPDDGVDCHAVDVDAPPVKTLEHSQPSRAPAKVPAARSTEA